LIYLLNEYFQDEPSVHRKSSAMMSQSPNSSAEEIIRKNPNLWALYQTGRFELIQHLDGREKKIILKEKTNAPDPKFTITKYKMPVCLDSRSNHDDHILLVSFSNSHMEPHQHLQVDSAQYQFEDVINKSYTKAIVN
jgi:hypothetical protein